MDIGVEDTCFPGFVIDKPSQASSVQDSAYSSPQPSSSWLFPENMSDSCSGTWSSPTPSIAYSPSPRPDFRNHYSTWSQANAGYYVQPFASLNQVQCQTDISTCYQQGLASSPYYHEPYSLSRLSEEQAPTFGIGDWTAAEFSQACAEHVPEASPVTSSLTTPTITTSNSSPERHSCPPIKQEECGEHQHICPKSSPRKEQANKSKTAYPCPFLPYGCPASFSSKNEWKRHLNTQHLSLSTYRCDLCISKPSSSSSSPQATNDFNRKDLFIQHLRRMHCKTSSDSTSTISSIKTARFDCIMIPDTPASLAKQADRCYIPPPPPPTSTQCIFCCSTFSGSQAWILRTEHISRHLERLRRDGQDVPKVEKWRRDMEVERWCLESGVLVLHRGRDGTGRPRVKSGRRV